ncbi:hypothetical protein GGR51DRAFT_391991 [Nemania sp. FL0031]|nr:hypothetical protein GGR51DRAFT_391991 [Nemania sp. FL0031]
MSTKTYHIVASDCDKELLLSELYSDVTVECGDKTWHLHRAIVMTRCPFFEAATSDNDVIKIDHQDPEQVDRAIYFIYTGKMPDDVLKRLKDPVTLMGTCIDLFVLANFFDLDGLRKRAVEVITEYLISEAKEIQGIVNGLAELEVIQTAFGEFSEIYLETVRTVYSRPELQPLKSVLMRYVKLTRYVALREQLLGQRLRTDLSLADFQADILNETLFRPFVQRKESMDFECAGCECVLEYATCFGDTIIGESQSAWCRKCKPLGEERVIELLGGERTRQW